MHDPGVASGVSQASGALAAGFVRCTGSLGSSSLAAPVILLLLEHSALAAGHIEGRS